MPNWFKKIQQENIDKSRWSFSVEAFVSVPTQMDEEQEKETASGVLRKVLDQVEGDSSLHTAVDSNVSFNIQFEALKV